MDEDWGVRIAWERERKGSACWQLKYNDLHMELNQKVWENKSLVREINGFKGHVGQLMLLTGKKS